MWAEVEEAKGEVENSEEVEKAEEDEKAEGVENAEEVEKAEEVENAEEAEQATEEDPATPARGVLVAGEKRMREEDGQIVTGEKPAEKRQVQFGLQRWFKPGGSEDRTPVLLPEVKKRAGPGRPPNREQELVLEAQAAVELALLAREERRRVAHEDVISLVRLVRSDRKSSESVVGGELKRGVIGGGRSNRRAHGESRRKKEELSAAQKLAMCERMRSLRQEFADERSWRREMMRRYDRQWECLQSVLDSESEWKRLVEELQTGLGTTGTTRKRGTKRKTGGASRGVAMRRKGGGRKDLFGDVKTAVKAWLATERSQGHFVDKGDCLVEFMEQLRGRAQKLKTLRKKVKEDGKWHGRISNMIELYESRLEKLTKGKKSYRDNFTTRLVDGIGAAVFKPQRVTVLTAAEERSRCRATWWQMDERIQLAAFGDRKALEAFVCQPEEFAKQRKRSALIFSDQVPFWCEILSLIHI